MADLLNFQITALGAASVNVPRAQISCTVVDSGDQTQVVADFTGANALIFPAVMTTLTAADRLELANLIGSWLVFRKAGLTSAAPTSLHP